jgi:hypothetical protein
MNIIELAKQSGLKRHQEQAPRIDGVVGNWADLEAFADLLAAHEREECIKVCEILLKVFLSPQYKSGQPLSSFGERHAVASCIKAIKTRGTK